MAEEEHKKKARLATAVLAGSALALSSFAFGVPAALAQGEQEPVDQHASETPEPEVAESDDAPQTKGEPAAGQEASAEASDDGGEASAYDPDANDEGATGSDEGTPEAQANVSESDVTLDKSEAWPGDTVTVSGEGFTPNAELAIVLAENELEAEGDQLETTSTDAEGAFSITVTIPEETPPRDYNIEVVDEADSHTFSVPLEVLDDSDIEVDPTIYTNPRSGPAGTVLTIGGSGFTPQGEVELSMIPADGGDAISFDPVTADSSGNLADEEVSVPDSATNGVYQIVAVDVRSGEEITSEFNVTDVTLEVDPESLDEADFLRAPEDGGGVTHTVEGLEPGDEVFFNVGNAYNPMEHLSGSATADEDGVAEYVVSETGDSAYIGGYGTTVTLGEDGPQVASGNFEVTSESPQVSLSDDPVVQGGSVLVSGYNFSADADVTIDWDPAEELIETQASETGELTYELLVPEEAELGTHDVVVTDENTDQSVTLELTVIEGDDSAEIDPEITLSVDEGYQGQSLTVTGTGFTPDGDVELVLGDQVIAATADDAGNIDQPVGIPADFAAGTYDLTARDVATDQETSAELTVLEATEPTLVISPEEITLDEFIRDSEDENDRSGVVHTIVGLEEGDELEAVVDGPEGVETVEREETVDDSGVVEFDIYGYDSVDPTTYLGTYDAEITIVDSENEPLRGSFEVVEGNDDDDETPGENEEISLSTDEAYPGDSLNITGSGFTPGDEVIFNLNPDIGSAAVDANGAFDADVTIPEDVEPGEYELTASNEAADESATAALTILDPADQVTEPALTIDPEEIAVDDFTGDPEDDAGVEHSVQGVAPGSEITYVVTGPEGVSEFESSGNVNDDGTAEFVIYAPEISNPAVYLGEYTTVVTYGDENGETGELQGNFSVVDPTGGAGAGDSGDQADPVAGGEPVNLNGSDTLATTGAGNVQLGLLAGVLLALGGAFVVYANRGRLFGRKH